MRRSAPCLRVSDDHAVVKTCGTYSGIGRSIGGKVQESTLELLGLCVTAHGDHGVPQFLDVLRHKVRETSVDVSRRDGIDTSKVPPLVGKRAS
jgi:hypothetical protein